MSLICVVNEDGQVLKIMRPDGRRYISKKWRAFLRETIPAIWPEMQWLGHNHMAWEGVSVEIHVQS